MPVGAVAVADAVDVVAVSAGAVAGSAVADAVVVVLQPHGIAV